MKRVLATWLLSFAALFSLVVLFTGPLDGAEPAQSLVAVGDMAECGSSTGPQDVSALLDDVPGDILGLGDLAYPSGSATDYADCFDPIFGRHKNRILPAIGNHDYDTSGAEGYAGYFGDAAGRVGQFYYAEQRGNWQVIVLNSNCSKVGCGPESAQYRWLETVLSQAPANTCRVVAMHHPRWSSYSKYASSAVLDPIVRLVSDAGTDLLLSGHAHHYERFAPQNADQRLDEERGFHQFIVGTGGGALRDPDRPAPNSVVRIAAHGVLTLDLNASGFSWAFVDTNGEVLDTGSDRCTSADPATPSPSPTPPPTAPPQPDGSDPQLYRLYRAVFLRAPDRSGLAYWSEERSNGRSLAQIADFFASSPEFVETYGSLSSGDFVERIYRNVLDRPADRGGYRYWVGQLDAGMGRGELVLNFSESPEFVDRTTG